MEILEAAIDIDPDTLNLKSKGRWITCHIELPEGYDVAGIDLTTVVLGGGVYAELHPTNIADYDADGIYDLMVKFDRTLVADLLEPADEVTITIEGTVEGMPFSGEDTIRVIDKGRKGKNREADNPISSSYPSSETRNQEGGLYYYHLDHLGTPQIMTDDNGDVVWSADYKPFGETDITINTLDNNFRFPGQYYDEETGLHYNYFRYYEPGIGRYLSRDPLNLGNVQIARQNAQTAFVATMLYQYGLSNSQVLNYYAYCLNNPVLLVDPMGLYWFRQSWQTPGVVGRLDTPVPPGGPVSEFIERYVPAGYTFGEIHDNFVGSATSARLPDWLVNIPSMIFMYKTAVIVEVLRNLGIIEQPTPARQLTPCK